MFNMGDCAYQHKSSKFEKAPSLWYIVCAHLPCFCRPSQKSCNKISKQTTETSVEILTFKYRVHHRYKNL